jgi:hypothetical protein
MFDDSTSPFPPFNLNPLGVELEITKYNRVRQNERASRVDDPAWLTNERGD